MIAHRHVWLHSMFATVFTLSAALAYAAKPVVTTVYPTGSFPLDMQNVQAAIDGGGIVLLKATDAADQPAVFDFGPPDPQTNGGVNLHTDVVIRGERAGANHTTIRGGVNPILGLIPVRSTIEDIDFDGPLDSPIALVRSTGADIVGNHIHGIVPFPLFFGTEIEGIFVSGYDDPLNAITGRIRIADNLIEVSGGDFVNGMQFDEVAADIEVTGNTVHFLDSSGVVQTLGVLVFRSHGKADVTNNLVIMEAGDPGAYPGGIFVGGHAEARYTISGNTVVCNHPNSDGIDVVAFSFSGATQRAVVEGNHVVMHSLIPTAGGIDFVGVVQDSLMATNRIEGTAGNAVQILGLDSTLAAESNRALGNDISQLAASDADVFLGPDSVDNLFAGHCRSYVDLGIGNRISCGGTLGSARPAGPAHRPMPMIDLGDVAQHARFAALRDHLRP